VIVEPKLAVPDNAGSEVTVGCWFVTEVDVDQRSAVPVLFTFEVLTVMKLPASAEVWEYVVRVAPEISEH
jgi:hypothetical protein